MKLRMILSASAGLLVVSLSGCGVASPSTPAPSEGAYTVDIGPDDFVASIDNLFLPLVPGSKWVYEAHLEDGTIERQEVEVTADAKVVNGVSATVVHDVVYVEDELVEETFDWYAQDTVGNVWYLGESVNNYEGGTLVDHAGSWEWGVQGALPGVMMWADPAAHIGEEYFQEFFEGEAEDKGEVLGVDESVTVPFGTYEGVVQTHDFSALDPELQEQKFYAAGVGVIKELDLNTGEEVVLLEFTAPQALQSPY